MELKGSNKKILVVGLSVFGDPVSQKINLRIMGAGLLVGGKRHLDKFYKYQGNKIQITKDINFLLSEMEMVLTEGKEIVVLATGDPLLFGIGNTLINRFGRDMLEVVPAVSSAQAALARLRLSLEGTVILSRHGQKKNRMDRLRYYPKAVILTDGCSGPSRAINEIIKMIPKADKWQGAVCQEIGTEKERIEKDSLKRLSEKEYHPNNLLVVENPAPEKMGGRGVNFGRPADSFDHHGMITHPELRAVTLSKLELAGAKIMWDLGAGSGSVGIEAALLNPRMKVFSVEKNQERLADIRSNIDRLKVSNLVVKPGNALDICPDLPGPDRVFIGGGGHDLGKLLAGAYQSLNIGGTMVVNTVTLDSAEEVRKFAGQRNLPMEAAGVQISRMKNLADYKIMKPENPVTIFKIMKNHE